MRISALLYLRVLLHLPCYHSFIPLCLLPVRRSHSTRSKMTIDGSNDPQFALIDIPEFEASAPPKQVAQSIIQALQTSGFLLVTTPHLTRDVQTQALQAATQFLERNKDESLLVVSHPTDPKDYAMLQLPDCSGDTILKEYFAAMNATKASLLQLLAVGLDLDVDYFTRLHDEDNDTLRLIRYHPVTRNVGNRCKEHSDYGTLTLLSTDGVSGLEALFEGKWLPVPHGKGALVVNIGTLLSEWTQGNLLATLHRVAGPASLSSHTPSEQLLEASSRARTSMAFFCDPNQDVIRSIQEHQNTNTISSPFQPQSVMEYIQWRSGGSSTDRSGVQFTEQEEQRVQSDKSGDK
jgi:isopenicillin N synthase-like dioxygenase